MLTLLSIKKRVELEIIKFNAIGGDIMLLRVIILILTLVGMYKTFEKAGVEGWKAIIPIYNLYILTVVIAKKPWWFVILFFIPLANIIVWFMICIETAYRFGESLIFGILLAFFPMIMFVVLGFNNDEYIDIIR